MKNLPENLIPAQHGGKQNNLVHVETFSSGQEANDAFEKAVERLFNVNEWGDISGFASANFTLTDAAGNTCMRPVREGDYLRISLPAPGLAAGNGFDWVKVEKIMKEMRAGETEAFAGFRVRSCANPQNDASETAHFFTDDATSTFMVRRALMKVIASYHGRNEKINTDTENMADKIRNAVVGAGALAGISELQWTSLIKSFLKR